MRKYLLVLLFLLPLLSSGQRWKKNRKEVYGALGVSNFMGDLGGRNQIGSNFLYDLEFSMTRFAMSGGYRYRIGQYWWTRANFAYGRMKGEDRLTLEPARNYRNLGFRSEVFELSGDIEFSPFKAREGHRYHIKHVKGWRTILIQPYGFVGLGGIYFNPKGFYGNRWYALQPLGTEGQGIEPGIKKYKRVTAVIPVGMGFKYGVGPKMNIGLEYGYRFTFTDYMDDVSTVYYDKEAVRQAKGDAAAYFADPSNGSNPSFTYQGQQRGDPTDRDGYMFALISVNYKLIKARRTKAKF